MNSTEVILDFLSFIADLRKKFGEVHLVAERCPALHDVTTEVIPFKGEPSDYAERGVTICLSLIAELRKPIDSDKKAIGVDLLLRHTEQGWIAEAEIGWSGREIGWDNFDEREAQTETIEETYIIVPPMVDWLGSRVREEIAK